MPYDVREGTLVIANSYLNDFSIFKQARSAAAAHGMFSARRSAWPARRAPTGAIFSLVRLEDFFCPGGTNE